MRLVAKIVSVVLTISFLITMYFIYHLNILPNKYFLMIGIVLFILVLGLDFKLIRKKTGDGSRVFFTIFSTLMIIANGYLLTYIDATHDFVSSMTSKNQEVVTYHVLAKENTYRKIKELENHTLSYLDTDSNYDNLKALIKKDISYKENSITEVSTMIHDLENQATDAILLEDSHYQMLKEEYKELENVKIVKSYRLIVKKKEEQEEVKRTTKDSFIVYISGIDTYGSISSVSRSDVNMVAVVNPNTSKILLVSIPRDYYVQLHNTTGLKDKLTHAGIYGVDKSIGTIEDLLDIDINYYIRLNFSTLTKSIDLLGGVDVYSDLTFTPWTNQKITIKEGMNHMNGEMALAFARERHAYATGDRRRGENQQAIITAMIKKMTDKSNIMKIKSILASLEGTFETSMSYEDISNFIKMQLSENINWDITSISLDGTGSMQKTYSMGNRNLYVMIPDTNTIIKAQEEIQTVLAGDH